jgi:hypothetical protein
MPAKEIISRSAAPFWPGHTAISARIHAAKNIVQPEIPPLDVLNEWGTRPFALIEAFSSDVTYNISQRVLI